MVRSGILLIRIIAKYIENRVIFDYTISYSLMRLSTVEIHFMLVMAFRFLI